MTINQTQVRLVYNRFVKKYATQAAGHPSKSQVLSVYRNLLANESIKPDPVLERFLLKKPVRTQSGVTPVTVLTKPYPCPGECIFCPTDVRMPKSYIASEPGAQRAAQNGFDPYAQVISRLKTYYEIGHDTGKIELIVLGGTWSVYPEAYQIWFIKRLFQALNDFSEAKNENVQVTSINLTEKKPEKDTYNRYISSTNYMSTPENSSWNDLIAEHKRNETSRCRCVGLVLETRPDYVSAAEIYRLRRLGATKIQIGIQSVNDRVLKLNKRGHNVQQTKTAISLLRQAGFKIHAHWMPNLYGNSTISDKEEYLELFADPALKPDELKIYPCSLIADTKLMHYYETGDWHPYNHEELGDVLSFCLSHTPEYCRLTRIVRDIPSPEIVAGNKHTNFRQMVEQQLQSSDLHDIRAREIKRNDFVLNEVTVDNIIYKTGVSIECFLQYITPDRKIAAFLRLSLPNTSSNLNELVNSAIIREIHVYGQAISPGKFEDNAAQHQGFGTKLISLAKQIAKAHGFANLAVISAVGTREYYRKKGFKDGQLFQHHPLD